MQGRGALFGPPSSPDGPTEAHHSSFAQRCGDGPRAAWACPMDLDDAPLRGTGFRRKPQSFAHVKSCVCSSQSRWKGSVATDARYKTTRRASPWGVSTDANTDVRYKTTRRKASPWGVTARVGHRHLLVCGHGKCAGPSIRGPPATRRSTPGGVGITCAQGELAVLL